MRFTGTLRTWNDDRGFGFIAPTQGGREIFVHVSALPRDGTRPTIGETLSYEVGKGKDGKPQAINVYRQAIGPPQGRRPQTTARVQRSRNYLGPFVSVTVALVVGAYAYSRYANRIAAGSPAALVSSTQSPSGQSAGTPTLDAGCDGRKYCSQMTSCAEAKFFLKNCPGTEMDGNNDGTPCEQQWCTSPFSK